jgi:hypothetical protein
VTTFSFVWKEKKSIFVDLKVFFFALVSEVTWYRQCTYSNFFDNSIRSQDMNFWNLDFSPVQARRFSLFKLLFKQEKSRFCGHFFGKMWLFFDRSACHRRVIKAGEKRLSPLQRKPAINQLLPSGWYNLTFINHLHNCVMRWLCDEKCRTLYILHLLFRKHAHTCTWNRKQLII